MEMLPLKSAHDRAGPRQAVLRQAVIARVQTRPPSSLKAPSAKLGRARPGTMSTWGRPAEMIASVLTVVRTIKVLYSIWSAVHVLHVGLEEARSVAV